MEEKQKGKDRRENNEHRDNDSRKGERSRKWGRPSHNTTFQGDHDELNGFLYTYDSNARANQFNKTTKKIAQWANKELMFSFDIEAAINDLEEQDTNDWKPTQTDAITSEIEKAIMNEEVKEYMLRKRTYKNNKAKIFAIVIGQCYEALKVKLEGQSDWLTIHKEKDLVKLLKSIKVWMLNQQGERNPVLSTYHSIASLFRMRQHRNEELPDFKRRFEAAVDVLEHIGVTFGGCLVSIADKILQQDFNKTRELATDDEANRAETRAFDKLMAVAFIHSVDKARFEDVPTDLENMFLKGTNQYPPDITAAYKMLTNWSTPSKYREATGPDGANFAQGIIPGGRNGGRDRSKDKCHRCGEIGHHAWEKEKCEKVQRQKASAHAMTDENKPDQHESDGDQDYEIAFCTVHEAGNVVNTGHILGQKGEVVDSAETVSFDQERAYVIPKGSVGLDSMSSVDVFGDHTLLTDIRQVNESMRIVCNAGTVLVNQVGQFKGYGEIWYHPRAIANILSLSNVQKRFKVTYDSGNGDHFIVHQPNGKCRIFRPTKKGLYASQILESSSEPMMVNTVAQNKKGYTRREVRRAEEARRLLEIVGRPSERQLRALLEERQLRNCDITEQDFVNARAIFGPDVPSLKAKTVRKKADHVDMKMRPIPETIMARHKQVVICFDVMHINNIPFAVSISRAIKFATAEALQNREADSLLSSVKGIKMTYARRGFVVTKMAADNEFAVLDAPLASMGISLNTVACGEHVPEIERHIRTLKERCRATFNSLPFNQWPPRLLIELVYSMTFWLHAFPANDGVSTAISPRELLTGTAIDSKKHCRLPFGAYVQTHEDHDNTMTARTVGAIALRPTCNMQGGHYFLSLATGRRIVRNHWTELPMTAGVITRVQTIAENSAIH